LIPTQIYGEGLHLGAKQNFFEQSKLPNKATREAIHPVQGDKIKKRSTTTRAKIKTTPKGGKKKRKMRFSGKKMPRENVVKPEGIEKRGAVAWHTKE